LINLPTDHRIEIIGVDRGQAELARLAFAQFGKGRHRAALNFGDCFSFALAKWLGQPLLFKGDHFCHTDLLLAFPSWGCPEVKPLLSDEHFSVDGTLLQAWASHASLERIDGQEDPPPPPSGPGEGFGKPKEGKKRALTEAGGRAWRSH